MTLVTFLVALFVPLLLVVLLSRKLQAHPPRPLGEVPAPSPETASRPVGAPVGTGDVRTSPSRDLQTPFSLVEEALSVVPREVPPDTGAPPHLVVFRRLADVLRSYVGPFSQAAHHFGVAAGVLERVTPLDEKLRALKGTQFLLWKPDLDKDLDRRVSRIRAAAARQDESEFADATKDLASYLKDWQRLVESWYLLREGAAAAIYPAKDTEFPKDGWLSHGFDNVFVDPENDQHLTWSQWEALARPELLDRLTEWLATEISQQVPPWDFTLVCPLSSTAMPLATLLSSRFRSKLVAINDKTLPFPPGSEPGSQDRVILVDSMVQSGSHVTGAIRAIEERHATLVGAVFVCENDRLPPGKKQSHVVQSLKDRNQYLTLFLISDLLAARDERVLS